MCQNCWNCLVGGDNLESRAQSDGFDGSTTTTTCNRVRPQTHFYCCGSIPPAGPYRKRHGMLRKIEDGEVVTKVEEALEADENEITYGITTVDHPSVPHVGLLPEQLYQGRAIEIQGSVHQKAYRFSINLALGLEEDSDIGIHINPRLDRRIVIRNHRIRRRWGAEEIASIHPFPFVRGKSFHVTIYVGDEQFLIALNYQHYCAFTFRSPLEDLRYLVIAGHLDLEFVRHHDAVTYPPLPYTPRLPHVIVPRTLKKRGVHCTIRRRTTKIDIGTVIEIIGRVKMMPQTFFINIQKGIQVWPHPLIALHINPRYRPPYEPVEREVIFNSWHEGSWGKEEKPPDCPFVPGKSFTIVITCKENSYSVVVNEQLLYNYDYRIRTVCDALVIHGDVIVTKISLR